ncbi:MAG: helix-turn-helix domain-containing protein [Actinomycetota bacterium]|nr:helix-turn-helix domain-containing protein [Actinomycetota bacterium]
MPRRPAAERHLDSAPASSASPTGSRSPVPSVDALVAMSHPLRRRLLDVLRVDGAASVGMLADRLDVAGGSVSHHIKRLHANGFVAPAPDLARDTRESWWRSIPVRLSWSRLDYAEGTSGREVAEVAERVNVEHHIQLIRSSLDQRPKLDPDWERAALVSDTLVRATPRQVAELSTELTRVVDAWRRRCAEEGGASSVDSAPALIALYALPVQP